MRWQELDEFPDYAVNDEGEVANIRSGMPRKTSINQGDIVKISLYKNRRELHTRSVAVLVAEAFVEGRTQTFDTPLHKDGDRENCRADNLLWRPRWFVIKYHRQFYDERFFNMRVAVEELRSGQCYPSVRSACIHHGVHFDDVYHSYMEGRPIPMTGEEFRLL